MSFTKEVQPKNSHNTINVSCERLFKDCYADVRSYLVEKAKVEGKTITIRVPNKGFRVFRPEDGQIMINKVFRSKKGTEPYQLVSFFWSDEKENSRATTPKVEAPQFEFSF